MSETPLLIRRADDVKPETRRGGEIRTLLSPRTVGATAGFMGTATVAPGDWIAEHYHPHSEELLYLVARAVTVEVAGQVAPVRPREDVPVPKGARHRVSNHGGDEAVIV